MNEKRKLNKKISIKDLFVVYIGHHTYNEITSEEIIIATKKEETFCTSFRDVITNNKYYLYSNTYAKNGDLVGFKPLSFISVLKESTYKDDILKKGYIPLEEVIKFYNSLNRKNNHVLTNYQDKKLVHPNCCHIINTNTYSEIPTLDREQELRELMISLALNKKIVVITGYNGVGKTNLIHLLNYIIINNLAPEFLQNKLLVSLDYNKLKDEKNHDKTIKEIINFVKENNGILIIDGFKNGIIDDLLLLKSIKENQIKTIITTTTKTLDEKEFDNIPIKEPSPNTLTTILNNFFFNSSKKYNISIDELTPLLDIIISILIKGTKQKYLNIPEDTDKNPKLSINIINNAFLIAKVEKSQNLSINHLIESLNYKDINLTTETKLGITSSLTELTQKSKQKSKQNN